MSFQRVFLWAVHILAAIGMVAYYIDGWRGVAIALLGIACLISLALSYALAQVAKKSPDVNGDPERDAGLPWPPKDDLQPSARVWDRGSARTAGATVLPPSGDPTGHSSHLSPTTSND